MSTAGRRFTYETTVRWIEGRRGELRAADPAKPAFEVAAPPEFRGPPGIWSPEDLYVAALSSCLMATFSAIADREGLEFSAFSCAGEGILERGDDGRLWFTKVVLRPSVTVSSEDDEDLARVVLELAEQSCMVSSSVKSAISLEPTIIRAA
jgi:organic hydroperoxide reductase OsmC/OhrA